MKVCTTCGTEYPDEQSFCPNDGSALKSTGGVADLVGSIVDGKYRITKKLGEGGMGAVYLGEHVRMGRMSAIKVMSKSMANDPDAIARFNREAANASQINHHNVCGIYDFGETDDGIIYLAMEFIEGQALTDLIEEQGALPPKRAAHIIKQTADALHAAHELHIVHRDLKPDNIMIAQSKDETDVVKVVDFGIAKAMGGDEEQNVTKTGLVVGTPEYMSPEQLSGDQVDGRSDTYSVALVFFRMLTGTLPFQADTAQEIMIKRLTDEPLKLSEAVPGTSFPPALQQALDHALERLPSNRYSSAAQFGADVMQAIGGMGDAPAVDADGATQLLDTSQIAGQAAVTGDEGTAIIPGTRVSGAQPMPTPDTPMPAPPPTVVTARKKPVATIAAVVGVLAIGGVSTVVVMSGRGDDLPEAGSDVTNGEVTPVTDPSTQQANATPGAGGDSPAGNRPQQTSQTPTESTGRQPDTPGGGDRTTPPENAGPAASTAASPAWLVLENAEEHLFNLMFSIDEPNRDASAIRDTAAAYFNAVGIDDKSKALAAFVTANAYSALDDRLTALEWARRAVQLDPNDRSYQQLLTDLQGGGGS